MMRALLPRLGGLAPWRLHLAALVLLGGLAAPAWAGDGDNGPAPTFHKGQLGISARFGLGIRGIITYDSKYYCGKTDSGAKYGFASACTGRAPLRLDLEAAYGVATSVELLVEMRLGLERDFGVAPGLEGPRPFLLAPGARFYFGEGKRTRLFITTQAVFDFTGYKDAMGASRGVDVGFRSLDGLWIDLHRAYGIYIYIAETAEVRHWIDGELEGGIGFQGRYP
jgi:hypothetical protein